MIRNFFLVLFVLFACISNSFGQKKQKLTSPDGNIHVSINTKGELSYDIFYQEKTLLRNCKLDMQVNGKKLGNSSQLKRVKRKMIKEILNPVVPFKFSTIKNEYNQLLLTFNGNYSIEFRAYNDGIAYRFYSNIKENVEIVNETFAISLLYELLKYRMINKGVSRSLKETHDLDDLVTSEISIVASTGIENFEIKKNHQLFQANYFITVGDYRAAFNSFVELNKLFEENIHLWNDPPVYYLMTVEGMLESLRIMHNYEGMDYFIEKLARLSSPSSSFQLNVTYVIFIYRLFSFIDVGNFKMAGTWVDEYQASLLDKILLLKEQQQAEISLYIALTHLGNGEYRKARKRLSTTIGRSHLYSLSLFRTIRIVNVMIHYELGDVDYIQSEVRSIKREMSKNKRHNLKVESFLLKFLNYSFTDKNRKKQVEIWKSVEEEIHALHEDKYEIQILRRFDFTAWVKAKIFNLSLGDVLSEKCNLAYK